MMSITSYTMMHIQYKVYNSIISMRTQLQDKQRYTSIHTHVKVYIQYTIHIHTYTYTYPISVAV